MREKWYFTRGPSLISMWCEYLCHVFVEWGCLSFGGQKYHGVGHPNGILGESEKFRKMVS